MSKLQELQQLVAEMFQSCEDKETIQKAAVVNNKMDEAIAEEEKRQSDYKQLLNDYKDVVLHSGFKAVPNRAPETQITGGTFDGDEFTKNWLANH